MSPERKRLLLPLLLLLLLAVAPRARRIHVTPTNCTTPPLVDGQALVNHEVGHCDDVLLLALARVGPSVGPPCSLARSVFSLPFLSNPRALVLACCGIWASRCVRSPVGAAGVTSCAAGGR